MSDAPTTPERFLMWEEARPLFGGLSRTTVWRCVNARLLPAPVQISPGRKAWSESAILAWQAARKNPNP